MPRLFPLLGPLALAVAPPAQTYIVDASGAGHFRSLPQAVATVPSGAVLRVRAGVYDEFTIAGKSLTIIGDSAATVFVWCGADVVIGPTQPDHAILLMSLTIFPGPDTVPRNVRVVGASGPVWFEDLTVGDVNLAIPPAMSLISDSGNVHFARCSFLGEHVAAADAPRILVRSSSVEFAACQVGGPGGLVGIASIAPPAIRAEASHVVAVSSSVAGGQGGWCMGGLSCRPGTGGAAFSLRQSTLHVYGCGASVSGGQGGDQLLSPTGTGGDGGTALEVVGSTVLLADVIPMGGAPGNGPSGQGRPGVPIVFDAASRVRSVPTSGPSCTVSPMPRHGSTVTLTLRGAGGEPMALLFGARARFVDLPSVLGLGALLCEPALLVGGFVIPASGLFALQLPVPLEWPLDQLVLVQPLTLSSSPPEAWAGNAASIVVRS